jgi:hypothetical protein
LHQMIAVHLHYWWLLHDLEFFPSLSLSLSLSF